MSGEGRNSFEGMFGNSPLMTMPCPACGRETAIGLLAPKSKTEQVGLPVRCQHCQEPVPAASVLLAEARTARLEALQLATATASVIHCIALALDRSGTPPDVLDEIARQLELQRDQWETNPASTLLFEAASAFKERR